MLLESQSAHITATGNEVVSGYASHVPLLVISRVLTSDKRYQKTTKKTEKKVLCANISNLTRFFPGDLECVNSIHEYGK